MEPNMRLFPDSQSTQPTTPGKHKRKRNRSERGASAVEFAIILPVLMFLILGMVEFSMMLKDVNIVSNAANAGARVASLEARTTGYQTNALAAVQAVLGNSKLVATKVVVYKADKNTGLPRNGALASSTSPTALATPGDYSSCTAECIVWLTQSDGTYIYKNATALVPNPATPVPDWPWQRQAACGATTLTDYLGVWVEFRHANITSVFGSAKTIRQRAIYRLEPTEWTTVSQCDGSSPAVP
jgi:Flp pilus assembly protein TadG